MQQVFPLTGWQEYALAIEQHPDAHAHFLRHTTLHNSLWIRPNLDVRRFRRAVRMLYQRHDITRAQFCQGQGGWRSVIHDTPTCDVQFYDYDGATDDEIDQIAHKHARRPIKMVDQGLVRVDLLRFGALGDVVVVRVHHSIVDGFGLTIILEDLIKLTLALPLTGKALNYAEYFRDWGQDTHVRSATSEGFWQQKLDAPAAPPKLGRVKRKLDWLKEGRSWNAAKNIAFGFGQAQAAQLKERSLQDGVTPFMLLNAAFLEAAAEIGGADDLLYSVTLGRSDGRLSGFAGHHTLHPLMRHQSMTGQSLAKTAQQTTQELHNTVQNLPNSAARRSGAWDRKLLKAGSYPRQLTSGTRAPSGRIKSSLFSTLFLLEEGQVLEFGDMKLKGLKMPVEPGDIDELGFRPSFDESGGELLFQFDCEAYLDDEIDELADGTFARLGMQAVARQVFEG